MLTANLFTPIPTRWIGPIRYSGNILNEEISVPLATYETPLWHSCARGAKISRNVVDGINVQLINQSMSRSVYFRCQNNQIANQTLNQIKQNLTKLQQITKQSSNFCRLIDCYFEIVGNLLFLRFSFEVGDASGHNMATKAADLLINHLLNQYQQLSYGSISANLCTDKKPSAINAILGRGKKIVADILIPQKICQTLLKTSAEKITQLNLEKNLIGSTLAGSIRSANAHFANMLLGFYLATGQDAANIIEGSQGIVHCEDRQGDLYFSCTLPNLIVGTVGNGKGGNLNQIEQNLQKLGCRKDRATGDNAKRLAGICAGVVLCGELSLLAAQTNQGELMRAHLAFERKQ